MNVALDALPNMVKIWLMHGIKFPSFPDQLKSRQNYQPLTHLQLVQIGMHLIAVWHK